MAKLSDYQRLRKAGLCTRDCGKRGELVNKHAAVTKRSKRRSECADCRKNKHGKK